MSTPRRPGIVARRARGFTLIEMIAAFVIFAIAVGALMQILTLSLKDTRRSLDETRAALWAQSLLDNVGIGERVEAGGSRGEFDRMFRWEMDIEQIDPQLVEAQATTTMGSVTTSAQVGNGGASPITEIAQMELYHVELRVIWGSRNNERVARFSTLRLALPDLNAGLQGGMGRGPSGGSRPRGSSGKDG